LNYDLDLDMIKVNQQAKYLPRRSFTLEVYSLDTNTQLYTTSSQSLETSALTLLVGWQKGHSAEKTDW